MRPTFFLVSCSVAVAASLLRAPLRPHGLHVVAPPRTRIIFASGAASTSLELDDTDGDKIVFSISGSTLQMFVDGELVMEDVDTLEYATSDGFVRQNEGEGLFQMLDGPERADQAAALQALAATASIEWREYDVLPELEFGGEEGEEMAPDSMEALLAAADGIDLPAEVEAMLQVDDELREQRPGAIVLWSRLLDIYPDEAAALAAVQRNSALVMPYLNKPAFIDGSWRVLLEMMPEADALEVVTKNPGILASNPAGLAMSDAETIKRAAGFVDGVENVLDGTVRKLFKKD